MVVATQQSSVTWRLSPGIVLASTAVRRQGHVASGTDVIRHNFVLTAGQEMFGGSS
jgi:hypothetical protein